MFRSVVGACAPGMIAAVVTLGVGCGGEVAAGVTGSDGGGRSADASLAVNEAGPSGPFFGDDAATGYPDGALEGPMVECPTTPTTLSGTVFDPAGKNPVYDAVVYIPNAPVAALTTGTNACVCPEVVGDYVTAVVTNAMGAFTLSQVPSGKNIPLVIQAGKWRRQVTVPQIASCQNTAIPPELTRLPRNRSEGDIPQMAVLTGACDGLACFMRRVGLDASEFTGPDGGGRMHVYRGAGPGPDLAGGGGGTAGDCSGASGPCPLWSTKAELERYDTVLLGCECGANDTTKPDKTPMHDWLGEGGVLLAIHNQDTWLRNGPADFQSVATWSTTDALGVGPFQVNTMYPLGATFSKWLAATGALAPDASLPLDPTRVGTSVSALSMNVEPLVTDVSAGNAKYMSMATPLGGDALGISGKYCGLAVISDDHVGAGASPSNAPVPASCIAGDLSPDEAALEFMLFRTPESCVTPPVQVLAPPVDQRAM
jgi:hypothetical protein